MTGDDAGRVRFVLSSPLASGNVGSVARAVKNFGFTRLDIVAPECDPGDDDARRMAVDAVDILRAARVHDDLAGALAGAAVVVGLTARRGKYRNPHVRMDRLAADPTFRGAAAGAGIALLFGREDHGLSDRELDRCTHLASLPTVDTFPSLNLAQAVALTAYELRLAGLDAPRVQPPEGRLADDGQREAFFAQFEDALHAIGFVEANTAETVLRRFRRLLGRAALRPDELKMLRGLARQMLWAARERRDG